MSWFVSALTALCLLAASGRAPEPSSHERGSSRVRAQDAAALVASTARLATPRVIARQPRFDSQLSPYVVPVELALVDNGRASLSLDTPFAQTSVRSILAPTPSARGPPLG